MISRKSVWMTWQGTRNTRRGRATRTGSTGRLRGEPVERRGVTAVSRAETILGRVNDLQAKQAVTRDILSEFDVRLQVIEGHQMEILQCLRALTIQRKPTPIPADCSTNITVTLPADAEELSEDIAPMPVSRRQRVATFCGRISFRIKQRLLGSGTGNNSDEGMTSPVPSNIFRQRFGSRASMDSSARRARREYRSIADNLGVDLPMTKRSVSIEPVSLKASLGNKEEV